MTQKPKTMKWMGIPGILAGTMLWSSAQPAYLDGKVVDRLGIPLEYMHVIFVPQENPADSVRAISDTLGRFSVELQQGYTYVVFGELYGERLRAEHTLPVQRMNMPYRIDFTLRVVIDTIYERIERLDNVYFEFNSARLLPESYSILDQWVQRLKQNPRMVIEVAGHTDSIGSDEYNLRLSRARAEAVRQYFIRKGISPDRVFARGYGERQPVADNGTEEGRARNRRVEIRIIRQ